MQEDVDCKHVRAAMAQPVKWGRAEASIQLTEIAGVYMNHHVLT